MRDNHSDEPVLKSKRQTKIARGREKRPCRCSGDRLLSSAEVRRVLGQEGFCPVSVGGEPGRRLLQQPDQVQVWVEPVLFRRFDQAEQYSTAPGARRCVREQEVLPGDNKRLIDKPSHNAQQSLQRIATVFHCLFCAQLY